MNPLLSFCSLVLLCCGASFANAQPDPFGVSTPLDAVVLSSNEIPTLKEYCKAPEAIPVSKIKASDLAATINDHQRPCYVLDVRSEDEYAVSHLPEARLIGFEAFSAERVWMLDRSAHVVVYSANKERGFLMAQYLQLMGFKDVQLLDGGLIGWKNLGYKVVDSKGETERVHVGKKSNIRLLKSGLVVN
jgi:rhodanese-related sulfurtransferase